MTALKDFFPPPNEILELEPEEVASFLLDYLCAECAEYSRCSLNRYNLVSREPIIQYAGGYSLDLDNVGKIIVEAWCWLEKEGMLAPRPDDSGSDFLYVTKKGYKYRNKSDLDTYRKGGLLPKGVLDNKLLEKVYPLFLRGDYDTAVFQAFKEVEVRVRKKAKLSETLYGVDLMRTAFNVKNGALTNKSLVLSEQQAMSDLFAGSIGSFKNPSSHREIDLNNANEAAEIILLANYLLRIVDRCKVNK